MARGGEHRNGKLQVFINLNTYLAFALHSILAKIDLSQIELSSRMLNVFI